MLRMLLRFPKGIFDGAHQYGGITLMGHRADAFTESQIDK